MKKASGKSGIAGIILLETASAFHFPVMAAGTENELEAEKCE